MIIRNGFAPTGHRTVEVNGMVYISGSTASDRSVGMKEQTQQILEKLDGFLEMGGTEKRKIVFANVFLTRMDLKAQMDEAWSAYFEKDYLPARCTVGVADLGENCLIEIQFIAQK